MSNHSPTASGKGQYPDPPFERSERGTALIRDGHAVEPDEDEEQDAEASSIGGLVEIESDGEGGNRE
jgi:hypothetical protein